MTSFHIMTATQKQTALGKLMDNARESADTRGHAKGRWALAGNFIRTWTCAACEKTITVILHPPLNVHDVSGDAVAINCPGEVEPVTTEDENEETRQEVIDAMARTLYLCAYADGCEDGEIEGPQPGPGEDWDDYAPGTFPSSAGRLAFCILKDVEEANKRTATQLVRDYTDSGGKDLELFAHHLGMLALGHGVSPEDDVRSDSSYANPTVGNYEYYSWEF